MTLTKAKTTGPAKIVRFKRRKQKRNKQRPLEAVDADWERWDAAARAEGLNWSEFTRRSLNAACERALAEVAGRQLIAYHAERKRLSENGGSKNATAGAEKLAARVGVEKARSRTKGK